jgi:hypothetical protein
MRLNVRVPTANKRVWELEGILCHEMTGLPRDMVIGVSSIHEHDLLKKIMTDMHHTEENIPSECMIFEDY